MGIAYRIIIALTALALPFLYGCKSSKTTVSEPVGVEAPAWDNVRLPVRVAISKPQKFTFNGTATLVRGEYMLISLRMLGFEVGTLYLTPQEADVVIKQIAKLWIQEPVGERLERAGLSFTDLQETMLGNRDRLPRLPESVKATIGGTETNPEVHLEATVRKTTFDVTLTWDLGSAKWNQESPQTFRTPGSDYHKVSPEQALKLIGGGGH